MTRIIWVPNRVTLHFFISGDAAMGEISKSEQEDDGEEIDFETFLAMNPTADARKGDSNKGNEEKRGL